MEERKAVWESRIISVQLEKRVLIDSAASKLALDLQAFAKPGVHQDLPSDFKLPLANRNKIVLDIKRQSAALLVQQTKGPDERIGMYRSHSANESDKQKRLIAEHENERRLWQQQRWPLVIAANGGKKPKGSDSFGLWRDLVRWARVKPYSQFMPQLGTIDNRWDIITSMTPRTPVLQQGQ